MSAGTCLHCDRGDEINRAVVGLQLDSIAIQGDVKAVLTATERIEKNMVTQKEFSPVRTLVYGGTGTILLGVLGWAGTTLVRSSVMAALFR